MRESPPCPPRSYKGSSWRGQSWNRRRHWGRRRCSSSYHGSPHWWWGNLNWMETTEDDCDVFVLPNLLTYLLLIKFSNVLVFTSPVSMLMKYRVASRSAVVLRSFSSAEWEISSLPSLQLSVLFTWGVEHVVQFEVVPHVMEGCWCHVQHYLTGGLLVSIDMVGWVGPGRGEGTCRI